jgi:hypothetical protein
MPAVFCADSGHDPGRFPGLENDHHLISLGLLKSRDLQSHHAFLRVLREWANPISELLNQSVQKDPVKTTVGQFDAILMMLVEDVHSLLLYGQIPGAYAVNTSTTSTAYTSGPDIKSVPLPS